MTKGNKRGHEQASPEARGNKNASDAAVEGGATVVFDGVLNSCPLPEDTGAPTPRIVVEEKNLGATDAASLIHELRVHQIELQMQNDELRRAQDELLASRDRAARLFNHAPVGYLVLDESGVIREANKTFCRMTGQDAAAVKGKSFADYLMEPDRKRFLARYRAFFRSPEGKEMNGSLLGNRRTRISVSMEAASIAGTPSGNSRGDGPRLLLTLMDVTRRKHAEDALHRSTRLLESIIDAIAAPVFFKNGDGIYLGCNAAFAAMLGLKRQDIVGKTAFEIAPVELARRYHEADIALMESGRQQVYETEIVHADGTRHQAMFHKSPFRDEHGAVAGIVGAMIDITDRKRMETDLRNSLREKVALLKEVHHRVKNNLQIVDSLLSLQANRTSNLQVLDVLRDSRSRVRSMALLHETLYRSGNLARIDFSAYVDELCRRILHTFGRDADGVRLETGVEDVKLSLDQAMPCGLIINELVSNALKYGFPDGRSGRVLVELSLTHEEMLVLRVSNDGVSLPDDLDPENTPTLGLKLVFDLAGQLDGSLTIERPNGAGAAFTLVFPAGAEASGGDPT
ncbi:MAG: sensor histidine kinase [Syntrophobacteraceae bacterium]